MSSLLNSGGTVRKLARTASWLLPVAALIILVGRHDGDLAFAEESTQPIRSPEEFERAIAIAQPGDTIIIANGRYDGWKLSIPATVSGSSGRVISIRGATPRGVTLSGQSRIDILGNNVEVSDLVFEGTGARSVDIHGNNNRLTRVAFLRAGTRKNTHRAILRIGPSATDNEIDHCEFIGSASVSIQVRVSQDKEVPLPVRNRIHDNLFKDIPRYSENGQEPIQLKCAAGRVCELMTQVEHNKFVKADGDHELISVKSSRNMIRYNLALDSDAAITLRSGANNLVEGNTLIRTKRGIVVTGNQQTVINNFISEPRQAGILIAIGSKRYRAATNSTIAHNTIVGADRPLRFVLRDPVSTALPQNNRIVNNIFVARQAGEDIIAANGPKKLSEYLSMNDVRRNIFWWEDTGTGRAPAQVDGQAGENIVADPQIDLSDPMIPALRANSPARHRALPGFRSTDMLGKSNVDAAAADIGAYQTGGQ